MPLSRRTFILAALNSLIVGGAAGGAAGAAYNSQRSAKEAEEHNLTMPQARENFNRNLLQRSGIGAAFGAATGLLGMILYRKTTSERGKQTPNTETTRPLSQIEDESNIPEHKEP